MMACNLKGCSAGADGHEHHGEHKVAASPVVTVQWPVCLYTDTNVKLQHAACCTAERRRWSNKQATAAAIAEGLQLLTPWDCQGPQEQAIQA
jgi:hypothetical protein